MISDPRDMAKSLHATITSQETRGHWQVCGDTLGLFKPGPCTQLAFPSVDDVHPSVAGPEGRW